MLSAGVLIAGDSKAQELAEVPRYDPPSYCRGIASFGGTYSAVIFLACIEGEQEAYDALKATWGTLPSEVTRYCNEIATFGGGGTYAILKACVDQELEARAATPVFKF